MERFNETLGVLCAVFGKTLTPALAKAYAMVLGKYNENDLVNAGMELMNGKFFPRPYDFKQIVDPDGILDENTETAQDRAEDAWDVLVSRTMHGASEIPSREAFDAMRGICTQHSIKAANDFQINQYRKRFIHSFRSKDVNSRIAERTMLETGERAEIGAGNE